MITRTAFAGSQTFMTPVWQRVQTVADQRPNAVAVIDHDGSETTYEALITAAEHAAAGLASLGLQPGDNIGAFHPNRSTWLTLWLAAARAGINVVGLNTRFRTAELNHLLNLADIKVVLAPDEFLGIDPVALFGGLDVPTKLIVEPLSGKLDIADPNISWAELVHGEHPSDPPAGDLSHLTIGFTTSGTTGFPKVACHTQASTLHHADEVIGAFQLDETSVALVALPLCGTFGFMSALPVLLAGGTVVLAETWNPGEAARTIAERGVTFCNGSDAMLIDVVEHPDFKTDTTWTTGVFADFTNAGIECIRRTTERTGGRLRLVGTYGSSEGFALMCRWPRFGSIADRARNGGPLVGGDYRVRVCHPETDGPLPHGEQGELQFKGANFIDSYLGNPEATAAAFTDGWFRSGDLGYVLDDTTFVYLARLGDSLRLRGFLCDPSEIEHHLEAHEMIERAQVVGVHQPGVGDVAVAFVIPTSTAPAGDLLEAAIKEHCADGLANYKQPERIVLVDTFPVTDGPNGVKVRKVELRATAQALIDNN